MGAATTSGGDRPTSYPGFEGRVGRVFAQPFDFCLQVLFTHGMTSNTHPTPGAGAPGVIPAQQGGEQGTSLSYLVAATSTTAL